METACLRHLLVSAALASLIWATPLHARYLQVDPVGYDDQVNLYAYVWNDPVNHTDPTGMCSELSCPVNYFNEQASQLTRAAEAQVSHDIGASLYEASGLGLIASTIRDPSVGGITTAILSATPVGRMAGFLRTASSAYRSAAAGGRHAGLLGRFVAMSDRQVQSAMRRHERTVAEHQEKIAHPERYMRRDNANDPAAVARARGDWQRTINRATEQRDIARDELRRRQLGD